MLKRENIILLLRYFFPLVIRFNLVTDCQYSYGLFVKKIICIGEMFEIETNKVPPETGATFFSVIEKRRNK